MPIQILAPDDDTTAFPPVENALIEPNGLLMAGGSLSPQRLIAAYRSGIFPWFEEGEPILWWSPDPRCVIWPDKLVIRRSLAKTLRRGHLEVTRNVAFAEVMRQCAKLRPGSTGTWITPDMIRAYQKLHLYGIAQSTEIWQDDKLVGGLYGISLGGVFVGESMFSEVSDASKVALVHLAQSCDYQLIDCQLETPHLLTMGAENIPRHDYLGLLERYGDLSTAVFSPDHPPLGVAGSSPPDL
ncbi:MAG: leucyl/phenylalanyl-tRNA--protein transferase [Gammaproteobacteria bacterium]|nr:leucyl/phenylalanyl-tRNA--protein transferase [Gammaproteobacteria bacterium]